MRVGVFSYNTEYTIRADALARAAEDRGFESLWVGEHTHIPRARRSPWPGGPVLPREYWHIQDPFLSLAAAAAVTTRIRLGTGICLVVEHDPIGLAKTVATLDVLSRGRLILGIGGGWNAEEMENHGTPFAKRWQILRERVLAMKAIWSQDEPEFHGAFVDFGPILAYPKPVQKPHPPILLAVNVAAARRRVVDYCDGWLPMLSRAGDLVAGIADLRRRAAAAGRDPDSVTVSVFGGEPDEAALRRYQAAGAERVILVLPAAAPDAVLATLDRYAALLPAFRP